MNRKKRVSYCRAVFFCTVLMLYALLNQALAYKPRLGDLLFQGLDCGVLCQAISTVTTGYHHYELSHVAMVVEGGAKPEVIEALTDKVQVTSLHDFLMRSRDQYGQARVIVGRLRYPWRYLIPQAVHLALSWQGLPYNAIFKFKNQFKTFYCSQLIYDAFMLANNGKPIFQLNKMTFKKDGKTVLAWRRYFARFHAPIPEGQLGSNPGMLSRSPHLKIIYSFMTKH